MSDGRHIVGLGITDQLSFLGVSTSEPRNFPVEFFKAAPIAQFQSLNNPRAIIAILESVCRRAYGASGDCKSWRRDSRNEDGNDHGWNCADRDKMSWHDKLLSMKSSSAHASNHACFARRNRVQTKIVSGAAAEHHRLRVKPNLTAESR